MVASFPRMWTDFNNAGLFIVLSWYLSFICQDIKSQSIQQVNEQKHRRLHQPVPLGSDKRYLTQICLFQYHKLLNAVIRMKT